MKRLWVCAIGVGMFLAVAGHASAQTVLDGSDKTAPPQAKSAMTAVAKKFSSPSTVRFQKIKTHESGGKVVTCGEVNDGTTQNFSLFGVIDGGEPVVFDTRPLPKAIDFNEVNDWVNRSAALDEIEEMKCAPKGSYKKYNDRLNKVLEKRKDNTQ